MSNSSLATLQCGRRPPMLPGIEHMLGHLKGGRRPKRRPNVSTSLDWPRPFVANWRNGENHMLDCGATSRRSGAMKLIRSSELKR
jgi:hypothetical protein